MKRLKKLMSNKLFKGIALIAGGSAFAQVLNILLSPIITRLYSPEEYGVLSIFIAIVGIVTIAGSLMYELAIPIAEDEKSALSIIVLCITLLVLFSISVFIVFLIFGNNILELFNASELKYYWVSIPIGVFFTGLYTIILQYAYRYQNFKSISKTKAYQSISQGIIQISYPLLFNGPIGLIGGRIIGQSAGFYTLGRPLISSFKQNKNYITIEEIRKQAKRYSNFPKFLLPSQFLNTLSVYIPVLVLSILFSNEISGYYGLAFTTVKLPMTLVGLAVADVFYSEAAKSGRSNPEKLKRISQKIFTQLFIMGIFPLLVLVFFGPFLFSTVFGKEWELAGVYSTAIAIMVFAQFIFTPVSKVYVVFEKQKESLYLNFLRISLSVIVFLLASIFKWTPYTTIMGYSIAMALVYFITFLGAQRIIKNAIEYAAVQ